MRLEDSAELALKHALAKASWAEARAETSSGDDFTVKNGNPETAGILQTTGLAVRVLVNCSLAAAFTNKLDPASIKSCVDRAVKAARSAKPAQEVRLSQEKTEKAQCIVRQHKKLADVSPEEKLGLLLDSHKKAASVKNIAACFLNLSTSVTRKYYINSEGTQILSEKPNVGAFGFITAASGTKSEQRMLQLGATGGWEEAQRWELDDRVHQEAKTLVKVLHEARPAPRGKLDLIVSPEITGIACHESVGHPYEADRILGREAAQAGESFITQSALGMRIGSDVVTVADDPTLPGSNGYYLYDDEGVRARPRLLMKDGVVNDFLQNRATASQMDTHSNAASRANSWSNEPIVRMANTYLVPGDYSLDELIEGVKRGVYVASYAEWNIDDKRWHQRYVGVEAYEIKNGKLGKLVRRPVIETTTPGFWQSVDAVGDEVAFTAGTCGKGDPMQGVPVWFGGAAARLRNMKFA